MHATRCVGKKIDMSHVRDITQFFVACMRHGMVSRETLIGSARLAHRCASIAHRLQRAIARNVSRETLCAPSAHRSRTMREAPIVRCAIDAQHAIEPAQSP
jgi:hypothetical protein